MTTVDPEDVVLYDIDLEATTEELYADPETQWFAVKRMAAEAVRAAGEFNPLLHPRGRDGKFINKFGWIRFFDMGTGKWYRAQVTEIDTAGKLHVEIDSKQAGDFGASTYSFKHTEISERIYTVASPKGTLDLPNPTNPHDAAGAGWKKVGGQGGSNPGGLYEIESEIPLSGAQVTQITSAHGLSEWPVSEGSGWVSGIYRDPKTGEMYVSSGKSDGLVRSLSGAEPPVMPEGGWTLYQGNSIGTLQADHSKAWFDLQQVHKDHAVGEKFYVKKAKSVSHAANEVLANRLYELAGVPVAETSRGEDPQMISSKLVNSTEDDKVDLSAAVSGNWQPQLKMVREDLVVDAWLANWDVVGLGLENVQVIDGIPYRIDAGGALYYRAQGAPKGHLFGPKVGEIDTLRDPSMNHQSAKVFGPTTDEELLVGAMKVAAVNPADIIALVDATEEAPPDLADVLIARRQDIIDRFELNDPWLLPPDMVPMDASDGPQSLAPEGAEPVESVDLGVSEVGGFQVGDTFPTLYFGHTSGVDTLPQAEITDVDPDTGSVQVAYDSMGEKIDGGWFPVDSIHTSKPSDGTPEIPSADDDEHPWLAEGMEYPSLFQSTPTGATELSGVKIISVNDNGQTILSHKSSGGSDAVQRVVPTHLLFLTADEAMADKNALDVTEEKVAPDVTIPEAVTPDAVAYAGSKHWSTTAGTWVDGGLVNGSNGYFMSLEELTSEDNGDWLPVAQIIPGSWVAHKNFLYTADGDGGLKAMHPLAPEPNTDSDSYFVLHNPQSNLPELHTAMLDAAITEDVIAVAGGNDSMIVYPQDPPYTDGQLGWPAIVTTEALLTEFVGPDGESWTMHNDNDLEKGTLVWYQGKVMPVGEPTVGEMGPVLTLIQPDGSELPVPGGTTDPESAIYVAQNEYTESLFFALQHAQEAVAQTEATADAVPTPVDAAFISSLNQKAATSALAEEMAPKSVAVESDADAWVYWNDAFDSIMPHHNEAMVLPEGIGYSEFGQAFLDEFSDANPDAPVNQISLAEFRDWLDEHGLDKEAVGKFLLEKNYNVEMGSGPPQPQVVEGISDKLSVTKKINFGTYGSEGNDLVAESMVGKVMFIRYADPEKHNISVGQKSYYLGAATDAGVYGLFYIESFDSESGVLKGRTATGKSMTIKTHGANGTYDIFDVSESVTVDSFKGMTGPVKKQNGDLVVNGQIVGNWHKAPGYYKAYQYTIFAEHSTTGSEVSGVGKSQNKMADYAALNIVPPPPAVTKKKTASKEYASVKEMISKDIPGDPVFASGETAKLGDWVKATKGGGGFVGKIVGWPNQETHPALAFAVSDDGVQKIIKINTHKKVDGPETEDALGSYTFVDTPAGEQAIPNAYADIKLADGNTPLVGQKVKAGAPGSEITGLINHINPEQGWVYILPDGGGPMKSKTYSVTTVLEQPNLIWDADTLPIAKVKAAKPSATPGKKKGKGPSYPAPDGSLIEQDQSIKDNWLAEHPKRKLTKDGYAPQVGMRVRLKGGVEGTIVKVANQWASNPNGLRVHVASEGKVKSASVTTVEIDHANELMGFEGKPPAKIHSLALAGGGGFDETYVPNGTQIFAYHSTLSWYSWKHSKTRTAETTQFIALLPDGTAKRIYSAGYNGDHTAIGGWGTLEQTVKGSWNMPTPSQNLEHVGTIDTSAPTTHIYKISAHHLNPNSEDKALKQAAWGWVTPEEDYAPNPPGTTTLDPEPTPELLEQAAKVEVIEIDDPNAPAPGMETVDPEDVQTMSEGGSNAPEPETVVEAEAEAAAEEIPTVTPAVESDEPVHLDENGNPIEKVESFEPPALIENLSALVPPKPATNVGPQTSYPAVPTATQTPDTAIDLGGKPDVLKGTSVKSLKEAAVQQIAQKDSTDVSTGHTYALGDSDLVEDMAFRYHVEVVNGQERLVMRFRLREDISEETIGKMVTVQGGKMGNWKTQGMKYPIDFAPGDAIAVRVGTNQAGTYGDTGFKMLKPHPDATAPNARVIAKPVYLGVTGGAAGEFDTYRIRVKTEQGVEGDVDIQMRPGGSVTNFEWDPEAPAPSTGSQLHLTPTAQEVGWNKIGAMTVPGMQGHVQVDSTGKWTPSGTVSNMANTTNGSAGQRLQRIEKDGSEIDFNSAHATEGGTGNETTRRANISGTVRISVPIDGRSEDEILGIMSKNMELVGLEPEAQLPPSNPQIVKWAMAKFVANYHPSFNYRGAPVTGPDDKRVAETLAHMNSEIGKHLGREMTLADIRLHTHENGRLQVVLSPEVGKAIAKRQGITTMQHSGASDVIAEVFGGVHSGLMSTDERWSLGVLRTGQSSHTDMRIGSGDRVYMRGANSANAGYVFMNPAVIAMGLEQYNNMNNDSDSFGRRGTTNKFLTSGTGKETMYKRAIDRTFLAGYTASSDMEAEALIKKLKAKGVTHIGGRPIELVIVGPSKSKQMVAAPGWLDTGMEVFADDIPITELLNLAGGAGLRVGSTVYTADGTLVLTNGEQP